MPLQDVLLSRPSLAAVTALLLTLGWRTLGSSLHRFFLKKTTILLDLPNIGQPRPSSRRIKGTAIICGGRYVQSIKHYFHHLPLSHSVAGLLSARVCADHFDEVLIIEPEAWLGSEEGRTPIYDQDGLYIQSRRTNTRARVEQYTAPHGTYPPEFFN